MPRYKSPEYGQTTMVAINLQSQLVEGSFEWALNRLIDQLDLSAFDALYRNDQTGASAYHPAVLLKVILLAYSKGVVSSRRIGELCQTNVVFIALAGGMEPHFATIAGFVSAASEPIRALFGRVLLIADEAGLIGRQMFAVDGVKLPANASKTWSGTREELSRKAKKMDQAVKVLLTKHRERDVREDEGLVLARVKQIDTLRAASKKVKAWLDEHPQDRLGPNGNVRKSNLTDADSAKMKTSHGTIQGYAGVVVVDSAHQIVVSAQAFGQPQEHALLIPMIETTRERLQDLGDVDVFEQAKLGADAGFHTEANVQFTYEQGIDAYIADTLFRKRDPRFAERDRFKPQKPPTQFRPKDFLFDPKAMRCVCPAGKVLYRNGNSVWIDGREAFKFRGTKRDCLPCDQREQCLRHPDRTETRQVVFFKDLKRDAKQTYSARMRAKIDSDQGRFLYSQRLGIVEPVFGNIKNKGLRRFTLRGKDKVDGQWHLFCLVHNIEKIARYGNLSKKTH